MYRATSIGLLLAMTFLTFLRPTDGWAQEGVRPYIHPDRSFSLMLPKGLTRGHPERYRAKAPELVLRSDDGYVLSIEARPLAMAGGESVVLDRLERLYMGPGKAWQTRVTSKPMALGGLPALRASYRGPETSGMVAVARGRHTDFLIMFMMPTALQARLAPQFEWILEHFDVAKAERRDKGSPLVRAPVFKGPGLFHHNRLGYTVRYPRTWTAAYQPPFSAVFTPRGEGPGRHSVRIRIQNVERSATDSETGNALLAQWRQNMTAEADGASFSAAKPLAVQTPSGPRLGQSAFANYTLHGQPYRQWVAVLPRHDGTTVHLWRYDAPLSLFETYQAQADSILRSLVMDTAATDE